MNKYLLLRDNKQTGPYSVEELSQKGLKPYDLVWLDGKSAAWRYPSEIEELKAFAPAIEEQPYDRFYKKQPNQQAAVQQSSYNNVSQQATTHTEAIVVTSPVTTNPLPQNITARKIYVTLPAGNRNTVTATTTSKQEQANTPVTEKEKEAVDTALLNEKFARIREEKIRQAEEMAANPIVANTASTDHTTAATSTNATVGFSEIVEMHYPQQEETLAAVVSHTSSYNSKLLLRSIVAACLLLGGIIIGLVISNSRHQNNNSDLDRIVKQIQEREKQKQLAAQSIPAIVQTKVSTTGNTDQQQDLSVTEPTGNSHKVVDQSANTPAKKSAPVVNTSAVKVPQAAKEEQEAVRITPAVVTDKPEEKPVNRQELEQARRNIHQLVVVDANKYKTGVLGGISDLLLTVSNNSLYPLDEVAVEIRYLGPEKRLVKTQTLLFSDVAAGEQKTVEAPRTNRGVTIDYAITRINSKALGLAHAGY